MCHGKGGVIKFAWGRRILVMIYICTACYLAVFIIEQKKTPSLFFNDFFTLPLVLLRKIKKKNYSVITAFTFINPTRTSSPFREIIVVLMFNKIKT